MGRNIRKMISHITLREIYLTNFEDTAKNGKPWTVMCSYNEKNGTLSSESPDTLTENWHRTLFYSVLCYILI